MPISEQSRLFIFANKIGDRFSTQPIIGVHSQGLWFKREALERDLAYGLGNSKQHICIDGPSGTGKTSLAQHVLVSEQISFISIQVFQDMTWENFCRNFVEIPRRSRESKTIGAQGALSFFRGLSASAELKHTEEFSEKENLDVLLATASSWTPNDIGRWLHRNNITLIVDDLEHANQELNMRLSSLCKLMGQSHLGKVILIGTDDILLRLLDENASLSDRVTEITVGGLASPTESASFLMEKFRSLEVRTPLANPKCSKTDRSKVVNHIYDAANGLMKELNGLGARLGREVSASSNLSVNSIVKVCNEVIREKRWNTRKEMNSLIRVIGSSVDTQEVVGFLASKGASAITYVAEIQDELKTWGDDQIHSALEILVAHEVITVTGATRKRVFFRNPTMLNAILAELRNKGEQQISLGLVGGSPTRILPAPNRPN